MDGSRASDIVAASLPDIADGMVEQARRRDATGEPARITEAVLKAETKRAITLPAGRVGLAVESSERSISPDDWPRLGGVDIVCSPAASAVPRPLPTCAFVELKWGAKDALWNCIWDVAKSALVRRLGWVDEALILGGFSDDNEWKHRKYGALLTTRVWDTAEFQRAYRSEWRYWARPPKPPEIHRTGPYRLPNRFRTALLERHRFTLDGARWSLGLVEVAPVGDRWLQLDEYAQPA